MPRNPAFCTPNTGRGIRQRRQLTRSNFVIQRPKPWCRGSEPSLRSGEKMNSRALDGESEKLRSNTRVNGEEIAPKLADASKLRRMDAGCVVCVENAYASEFASPCRGRHHIWHKPYSLRRIASQLGSICCAGPGTRYFDARLFVRCSGRGSPL